MARRFFKRDGGNPPSTLVPSSPPPVQFATTEEIIGQRRVLEDQVRQLTIDRHEPAYLWATTGSETAWAEIERIDAERNRLNSMVEALSQSVTVMQQAARQQEVDPVHTAMMHPRWPWLKRELKHTVQGRRESMAHTIREQRKNNDPPSGSQIEQWQTAADPMVVAIELVNDYLVPRKPLVSSTSPLDLGLVMADQQEADAERQAIVRRVATELVGQTDIPKFTLDVAPTASSVLLIVGS